MVVWCTDNLAAAYMINKGGASKDADIDVLREIYSQADTKRIQLISIWVSRDCNEVADHLSHLTHILSSSSPSPITETSGFVQDL